MKSPIVIKLNGTVITGRIDGIEQFNVTYRENDDDGGLVKSYSSELKFYDDGYLLLKNILIDNPNGFINEVNVELFDECCAQPVFTGYIVGGSIDWCDPECWISTQVVQARPELNCIKSRLIYDNELGFLNRPQKKLRYCLDLRPDWILGFLFNVYAIFNILIYAILLPLSLVVVAIQSIAFVVCSVVCAVSPNCTFADCQGGTWTNPVGAFSEISGWLDDLQDRMIKCQWYHPTPLVRDYIKNVCDVCGLTFQSSILNDPASPYYNLMLFSAMIRRGYKPGDTESRLISENLPIETLDTLMNRHLKPLFNAQYWIVGNTLVFERKDFFATSAQWIDAEQMLADGRIIDNQICFSWIDTPKPAFGQYTYSMDASDLLGNETKLRYDEIVEWNSPASDTQSGSLDRVLLSSMARFRGDWAAPDTFDLFYNTPYFNTVFGGAIANSEGLLLMSQHTAFNYKFMIWDPASGDENAKIKGDWSDYGIGQVGVGQLFSPPLDDYTYMAQIPSNRLFNYPMWFKEGIPLNLYTRFHFIDNPRLPGAKMYNFNFTFGFDCGEFDAIDFSKSIRIRVGNSIKFGEIKELQIDFVRRTIGVSGIV
jgi:hypothetical protein